MILLAMMFILSSRCGAAACTARGPAPTCAIYNGGTLIKRKITDPAKLSVYIKETYCISFTACGKMNYNHVLLD